MSKDKKELKTLTNDVNWHDITEGGMIPWAGNAALYETGSWRSMVPVWNQEKCKNCTMCFFVCPDSSVIMTDEPRMSGFDLVHCKGCGVCVKTCKFGAIDFVDEHKKEEGK